MRRWWPYVAFAAAVRVAAFSFAENVFGDSVVRAWFGALWVQAPHVIGSFDQGAAQFGPLHIYLVGLFSLLPLPLSDSSRLVSLVCGVASVWPLIHLTRSLFGDAATRLTAFIFSLWGLHLQVSTTAGAEALNLLLVLACLCWLQQWLVGGERVWLLSAALALNLACATRYDSWLYVPLLVTVIFWHSRRVAPVLIFGLASTAFALAWCFGNFVDRGSPLYPFEYIEAFHRAWFSSERAIWGAWYPAITALFWPGVAFVTLTPLAFALGVLGGFTAWRNRPAARWLIMLMVVPTLLYTFRSTVLQDFVPLARFTAKEVTLLVVFVGVGLEQVRGALLRRVVLVATVVCAVVWPPWLSALTVHSDSSLAQTLRAVSPITVNRAPLKQVAKWLAARSADGSTLVIDVDPRGYDDIQLASVSGFAYERIARARAASFEARLRDGVVRYVVKFEGGPLEPHTAFRGAPFDEVAGFEAPFHVFALRHTP